MRHVPLRKPGKSSGNRSPGHRRRWQATVMVVAGAAGLAAAAGPAVASAAPPNSFSVTNLIANQASSHPNLLDKTLKNAWGIAAGPNAPLWVADNNAGRATVYTGGVSGSKVSLALTVMVPG